METPPGGRGAIPQKSRTRSRPGKCRTSLILSSRPFGVACHSTRTTRCRKSTSWTLSPHSSETRIPVPTAARTMPATSGRGFWTWMVPLLDVLRSSYLLLLHQGRDLFTGWDLRAGYIPRGFERGACTGLRTISPSSTARLSAAETMSTHRRAVLSAMAFPSLRGHSWRAWPPNHLRHACGAPQGDACDRAQIGRYSAVERLAGIP